MNKKGGIIALISLLSILVILLISLMVFVILNGKIDFMKFGISSKISNNLIYDKEFENKFEKINIKSDASDIKIKKSDDSNIKVLVYSEKERVKNINVSDNTSLDINLKMRKGFNFSWFNYINSKIEVYIPKDYSKDIKIETSYGDIEIDDFIDSNIDIVSDCGDIEIDSGNSIKIENKYGDTIIKNANSIDVNADCGDIEIGNVKKAKLKNSFGDIEIKNVYEYIDIEDNCGDISIDNISLKENSNIKDNMGDIEIKNIKDIYIDAKTSLGDVSINNNYRKSNITLKIENDCGDIEVDN